MKKIRPLHSQSSLAVVCAKNLPVFPISDHILRSTIQHCFFSPICLSCVFRACMHTASGLFSRSSAELLAFGRRQFAPKSWTSLSASFPFFVLFFILVASECSERRKPSAEPSALYEVYMYCCCCCDRA